MTGDQFRERPMTETFVTVVNTSQVSSSTNSAKPMSLDLRALQADPSAKSKRQESQRGSTSRQ